MAEPFSAVAKEEVLLIYNTISVITMKLTFNAVNILMLRIS